MSSYVFSKQDVRDAYRALALQDEKKRFQRLRKSKLLALIPHGTEEMRVALLETELRRIVEGHRLAARQLYNLGEPRGTTITALREQINAEFKANQPALDRWSAVYFYRICRWNGTEIYRLFENLGRFSESSAPKQLTLMEQEAYEQITVEFQQRFERRSGSSLLFDTPPYREAFIARPELDAYYLQLKQHNFALITGAPGTGKTTLGAEIARRLENEQHFVIWVNLTSRFTLELLFEHIAHDLDCYGDTSYGQRLLSIDAEQGPTADHKFQVKLNELIATLSQQRYALILNDAHEMMRDGRFQDFIQKIWSNGHARLPLVLISRNRLDFLPNTRTLAGLSVEATQKLLESEGIRLPADLLPAFHRRTQGNPKLIELVVHEIRAGNLLSLPEAQRHQTFQNLIENLVRTDNILDYLNQSLLPRLSEHERSFLELRSVIRTRMDIDNLPLQEFLFAQGIERADEIVASLRRKYLLRYSPGASDIQCDEVITSFIYRELSFSSKKALHERVARFHSQFDHIDDAFEAAYHWYKASQPASAAAILLDQADAFFAGVPSASRLKDVDWLIGRLDDRSGLLLSWQLLRLRGRAREHLGEYQSALDAYRAAIKQLQTNARDAREPKIELQLRCASLLLLLGEQQAALAELQRAEHAAHDYAELMVQILTRQIQVYDRIDPGKAIACGLRAQSYDPALLAPNTSVELQRSLGYAFFSQGDVQQARALIMSAYTQVDALPPDALDQRIMVLNDWVNYHTLVDGNLAQALSYGREALELAERLDSRRHIERTLGNLGLAYHWHGNFDAALDCYRRSLHLSQITGHARAIATDTGNIGVSLYRKGQHDEAREHLLTALAFFHKNGDMFTTYVAAFLAFLGRDYCEVREYADLAEQVIGQVTHPTCVVLACRAQAHANSLRRDTDQAVRKLEEALAIANQVPLTLQSAVCAYELSCKHPDPRRKAELHNLALSQFERSDARYWIKKLQQSEREIGS